MAKTSTSRNLRVVTITSLLGGFFSSMTQAVWQPFVLSLGAPMSTLGLLESLGGWRGVVTAAMQPVGGWLADRIGRKPLVAGGNAAGLAAVSFYLLAALTGSWGWLVPGVILLGAWVATTPAQDSLIAESAQAGRRGTAYSVFVAAWMAPGVFAPALGGFIADRWGFPPVFLLRLGLEGLCLFLVVRFLRETLCNTGASTALGDLRGVLLRTMVPPRKLRGLYWAMAVDAFVWGVGSGILFGMLSETFGFTTLQLGMMSSLSSLTMALSQVPIGRLVDRFGSKPFMVLSDGLGALIVGGWLLSSSFPAFAFLHACFGVMAAAWVPAQLALFANSVPKGQRAEALGQLAAFRGLIGFPAPYIGGLLFDRFGFRAPVLANLLGALVATLLIALVVKEPPREGSSG